MRTARMFLSLACAAVMGIACGGRVDNPVKPTDTVVTVSIAITGDTSFTAPGQTAQLRATATLSDGSTADVTAAAVWRTDNDKVATISPSGLVTAISPGRCTVEAISGGVTGSHPVELKGTPNLVGIRVTGASAFTDSGQTSQMRAVADFSDGSQQDITDEAAWSSTNPDVASVTTRGLVTAHQNGECEIVAVHASFTARVRAEVKRSPTAIGLRVTGTLRLGLPGETVQLRALLQLSDGSEMDVTDKAQWNTSNAAVATVSATGLLKAGLPGTCDVTAVHAGITARAAVNVGADVPKIVALSIRGATRVALGQATELKAIAHMSDGTEKDVTDEATWSTSNSGISLFTRGGLLTAINLGTCEVIAVHLGVTAKVTVLVTLLD